MKRVLGIRRWGLQREAAEAEALGGRAEEREAELISVSSSHSVSRMSGFRCFNIFFDFVIFYSFIFFNLRIRYENVCRFEFGHVYLFHCGRLSYFPHLHKLLSTKNVHGSGEVDFGF